MTEKLSDQFFGNKILKQQHYDILNQQQNQKLIRELFSKYISKIQAINPHLIKLFVDFVLLNIGYARQNQFSFQKFTTFVELTVHIFQISFENNYSKEQSFQQFRNIIIRHSLFRPPHSVNIYNEDEVKHITKFWLQTFDRYYSLYENCFGKRVEYELETANISKQQKQLQLKKGKVVDKNKVINFL